jgi:hypothetical protein
MAVPADIAEQERNQEMNQWYRAEIRWAVMEEGTQGLREWKDAVYFFKSESQEAAFQHALEIGHRDRDAHEEDGTWVETRLAQIVSLDWQGANPPEFHVSLGSTRAPERLAFEHVFDPEGMVPLEVF